MDLTSLYPSVMHDTFPIFRQIHQFQHETNADRFFSRSAPSWFRVFILLEAVYHVPASVWAIGALLRGQCSRFYATECRLGARLTALQTIRKCPFNCSSLLQRLASPLSPVYARS